MLSDIFSVIFIIAALPEFDSVTPISSPLRKHQLVYLIVSISYIA